MIERSGGWKRVRKTEIKGRRSEGRERERENESQRQ